MSILLLIIGFAVVLGPLIFLHELGHFLAAKRAGIRVLEFGFGFPPRIIKFWQGEGHLSVGGIRVIIPANFKGLPPSAAERKTAERRSRTPQSKDAVAMMRETPEMLDVGAYVEVIAEERSPGRYTLCKLGVLGETVCNEAAGATEVATTNEASVHLRGELTGYVPGTIYSVNWLLPLGGFVRMLGEEDPSAPSSFAAAPKRWRAVVLLAGSLMNLLLAVIVLTAAWMLGFQKVATCRYEIVDMVPNFPAAVGGLQLGDFLVSINGEPADDCYALSDYIRARAGQRLTFEIERGGRLLSVPLTLLEPGQYNPDTEGPSGLYLMTHPLTWAVQRAGLLEALSKAADIIISMVVGMLSLPAMVLNGLGLSSLLGPIGISQAGGEAIQASQRTRTLFPILTLVGQVSVAVGLTNLLPLPAMDGGRLMFVALEWARGRRVDPRKEMVIHLVGLGLLLILVLLVSCSDIVRLVNKQPVF